MILFVNIVLTSGGKERRLGEEIFARPFLAPIEERFPYKIKAIQIDGGSEFKAEDLKIMLKY